MVIDSHALLWWLEGGSLLSRPAREVMREIGKSTRPFVVSAVTLWEGRCGKNLAR